MIFLTLTTCDLIFNESEARRVVKTFQVNFLVFLLGSLMNMGLTCRTSIYK